MKRPDQRVRASLQGGRRDWYKMQAQTDTAPAEVLIYDEIGWYGVTADGFVNDLKAIDGDEIVVRVNSPGGDVYDGIAILNALRGHKAKITTIVDGLAASAASFIAMAGDEIVMNPNSEMMIHDAWGYSIGNAEDMHKAADDLDRVSNNIASIYAERAGGTTEAWREVMRAETWYSAQEAVDAGLANRVGAKQEDDTEEIDAKASFDLSIFNYAGRKSAPAPKALAIKASDTATEASAAATTTTEGGSDVAFTDEQTGELREALSLSEDATDQEIFDAVLERLTAPEEAPAAASAAALPEGVVAIEASVLNDLRTNAARGAQARAQQEQDARENLVNAAVQDGRIAPARKDHWLNALKADHEGAAASLASLAPGLIPVTEIGHAQASESTINGDAILASLFGSEA